jgi:hypothetical protein
MLIRLAPSVRVKVKTEAVCFSETSITAHQASQCHEPEDHNMNIGFEVLTAVVMKSSPLKVNRRFGGMSPTFQSRSRNQVRSQRRTGSKQNQKKSWLSLRH